MSHKIAHKTFLSNAFLSDNRYIYEWSKFEYKIETDMEIFTNAEYKCNKWGGKLAKIESEEEYRFISRMKPFSFFFVF